MVIIEGGGFKFIGKVFYTNKKGAPNRPTPFHFSWWS